MRKTCFGLWLSRPSVAGLHMGGDIDVLYIWTMMAKLGSGLMPLPRLYDLVLGRGSKSVALDRPGL